MFIYILLAILTLCYIYYYFFVKKRHNYWNTRGVKGPKPIPIVGNFGNILMGKESVCQLMKRLYEEYPDEKVIGIFRGFKPMLVVKDPTLVKHMLITDFNIFQDRGVRPNVDSNRINDNLLVVEGETWRLMRQKITPVFSSSKLKNMIPLISISINKFMDYVLNLIDTNINHEIKSLMEKYTMEVIGYCVFGLSFNIFCDDKNEFSDISKKMFKPSAKTRLWQILDMLIPGIRKCFPHLSDSTSFVQKFFVNLVNKIIHEREGKDQAIKDFMSFMMNLKQKGKIIKKNENSVSEIEIDDELIAAQALLFYYAGYETSAATMSFLLYELAMHQNIQNQVHAEICKVYKKYNNDIDYESLSELTYLEAILDETLRKHPVVGLLLRKSLQKYTFPGTSVTVEKGTRCFIPVAGLHNDPKYYANPNEFNPERYSNKNKSLIPQCTYLPFGTGPRNCLGTRFAKIQIMMGMSAFLKKFKVEPSDKTKQKLVYSTRGLTLRTKDGIWLKISKR